MLIELRKEKNRFLFHLKMGNKPKEFNEVKTKKGDLTKNKRKNVEKQILTPRNKT